jgi:phosphopantothenoylcysteine decarboxylase
MYPSNPLKLAVVVCAALPARTVQEFVALAHAAGYDVWLIATPNALAFIDLPLLTNLISHPVISSSPTAEDCFPDFDMVVVAPATFNTIKKWAQRVPDTFALHFLLRSEQQRLPILVIPRASPELAQDPLFLPSLALLRSCGIMIYYEPDLYPPNNNLSWSVIMELLQEFYTSRMSGTLLFNL